MYGSAHSLGVKAGWVTNGDVVVIFLRLPLKAPDPSLIPAIKRPVPRDTRQQAALDALKDTPGPSQPSGSRRKVTFSADTEFKEEGKGKEKEKEIEIDEDYGGKMSIVLSPPIKWTDPRLVTCLVGFSFMLLDLADWEQSGVTLEQLLCPDRERHVILAQENRVLAQRPAQWTVCLFQNSPEYDT